MHMPATDHQNLSRHVNEQPANSEPPAQTRFSDPASRQRGAFDQQIASNKRRMVDVRTDNTRVLVDDYESSDCESQIGVRRAIDISPRLPTTHLDVEGVLGTNYVIEGVERQNSRPSRVHRAPSRFDVCLTWQWSIWLQLISTNQWITITRWCRKQFKAEL